MKRKITLLLLAAGSLFTMNSQVLFQEDFTSPFNPATNGWNMQNLSTAANPTLNWFQGNPNVFSAYNGAPADYVGSNFAASNNTTTAQTLSNWLITPTLNIINGNVVEFATRTTTNPASFPDRLEVYLSLAGTGTNVGTSATSVGTFSTLLVSINPSLTTTGYPGVWTVYQATITGVPISTLGRVGFRYYVTNGGGASSATNSDYIGLDAFKYSSPCTQPTLAITSSSTNICSGSAVTLSVATTGSVAASTYTWNTGSNATSINVTPTTSTIYTVTATTSLGCTGTQTAAISVTASPVVSAPSYTVCNGTQVSILATGATTYSWSNGATTNSITVSPSASTVYVVTGYNGNCSASANANITVGSQLSVSVAATSTNLCSGRVATLTAISAGTTYSWTTGATVPTTTVAPTTTTTYTVGALAGACAGYGTVTINVLASPSLSVSLSPTTVCSGSSFTVTTSGANTYTYVLSSTQAFTNNPIGLVAPNVTSLTATGFTLGGTATNGCLAVGIVTLNVNPNPTVTVTAPSTVCVNHTISITGAGASTYQWSGASTSTASALTYSSSSAGTKNFTLTGTSAAGCTGTTAVAVNVVTCATTPTSTVGLPVVYGNEETAVYPNPFTTEIKINNLDGHVIIFNALGQAVINTVVNSSETINTTELPKGVYLIKAFNTNGDLAKTAKLIKN